VVFGVVLIAVLNNFLIHRAHALAASVTRNGIHHARNGGVALFSTPETTGTQHNAVDVLGGGYFFFDQACRFSAGFRHAGGSTAKIEKAHHNNERNDDGDNQLHTRIYLYIFYLARVDSWCKYPLIDPGVWVSLTVGMIRWRLESLDWFPGLSIPLQTAQTRVWMHILS